VAVTFNGAIIEQGDADRAFRPLRAAVASRGTAAVTLESAS